jgi:hypothetical protein
VTRDRTIPLAVLAARAAVLDFDPRLDSCVATVRVLYDALKALGIDADVYMGAVVVHNQAWEDEVQAGRPPMERRDAWSLGIGLNDTEYSVARIDTTRGQRPLHVVILTEAALLDPSLDQAARPKQGIDVGPAWFPLTPELRAQLLAGQPLTFALNGVYAREWLRPRDKSYTTHPDWGRGTQAVRSKLVGHVIRAVRIALETS